MLSVAERTEGAVGRRSVVGQVKRPTEKRVRAVAELSRAATKEKNYFVQIRDL